MLGVMRECKRCIRVRTAVLLPNDFEVASP